MKINFKENFKGNFKNKGTKAKIMLGLIALIFLITITVVNMRKTIKVNIDGKEQTFVTYKGNVEDALVAQGIEISNKDKIEPSLDSKISEKEIINIKKAVPVNIVIAGKEHELLTAEETVGDMILAEQDFIKEQGGNVDEDDEVTPSRETRIGGGMEIKLVQVEILTVAETENINYETIENTDENKNIYSEAEIAQVGVNGTKSVEYKVYKYEDGTEKKIRQSETIVQVPQDEIIVKGGGYFMASRGSESIKVQKDTMTVTATAYYEGNNAITATGRKAVRVIDGISTIAVDPRVIPLGSLVYVEGYGKAVAADTGSAIKGNIIDLYLTSREECMSFGRRHGIKLGIIAYPGEW